MGIITLPRCSRAVCSTTSPPCSESPPSPKSPIITAAAAGRLKKRCTILKIPPGRLAICTCTCQFARVKRFHPAAALLRIAARCPAFRNREDHEMSAARAEDRPNIILVVELTPDKKVVWVLQGLEEGVLYCLRLPGLVSGDLF